MGSSGIKPRKRRRAQNTPPSAPISEGDVNRLFGRFTWGAFTPAGNLERNGFLWRQLSRRRKRDGWTVVAYAVLVIFALPFVLALVAVVVNALR